ncbi:MAG TPA: EamA family transporter [Candidatus Borkfalkia excrementigallinarum]|uniref:EamA family transporter n=1 Tax=Candidatus Borkfalkia excrementigallinarum TaxID=2838506 RepID=A0A9D2CT51_9FIRM|nr:EamA family transporter [Candidatus Borkfalkia excrementigallinarum]
MWIAAAIFSALFAGITAILSKCGIKNANSDVATAVRTSVVLVMAWAIVLLTGAYAGLAAITARSWVFLILSGAATGASWICYFKALSLGEVSKVAAVDKSSAVLSVLFAIILFPDERVFGGSN